MNAPLPLTIPNWPFGDLQAFTYGVIMADPPWLFENWSRKGLSRNAMAHYDCMPLADIKALPVGSLAAEDCALFLWATSPLLPEALEVMSAWGFTFKGKAFCWAKATKQGWDPETEPRHLGDDFNWRMNNGYGTRSNTEDCWLGVSGSPERLNKGVRELIVSPLREHSRKPDEAFDRAQTLYGGPCIELFSRQNREGWDCWGNEVGKFGGDA